MAIRGSALGGTDWGNEGLTYTDLNDTFNALTNKVQTLTTFWLNSDLYEVYDDFESYSTGNFETNAKWDITITLTSGGTGNYGTSTIESSTAAGGTGKELKLFAYGNYQYSGYRNATVTAVSNDLPSNKHVFTRLYYGNNNARWASNSVIQVGLNSYQTIYQIPSNVDSQVSYPFVNSLLLVIAKGGNYYDVYVGGKLIQSNVYTTSPQLQFRVFSQSGNSTGSRSQLHIDDVRISKGSV